MSDSVLHRYRERILELAAHRGTSNVHVFGSAARGEIGAESDFDFLVEMEPGRSLLDQIGLIQDLEDLLGRKVDLVEPEGVHWYIRERVLQEAVAL